MAWEQIAGGDLSILKLVDGMERLDRLLIAEGQRAKLVLNLRIPALPSAVSELQSKLTQAGVSECQVSSTGTAVEIIWKKNPISWLPVIVIAILGVILLAILIVSWQLFRYLSEFIPAPLIASGVIILILAIAVLAWKK